MFLEKLRDVCQKKQLISDIYDNVVILAQKR